MFYWRAVKRAVERPDFLFCAADTGENIDSTPLFVRTGTTNWINNAALNGGATNAGPGVIRPPIRIAFHKLGALVRTWGNYPPAPFNWDWFIQSWGSFGYSTNSPVYYPSGIQQTNQLTLRLRFFNTNSTPYVQLTNYTWHLPVPIGGQAALQISTNQTDWVTFSEVRNAGAVIEWYHYGTSEPQKFFRVVPE